jgi:diguanylate cyclase (GGDEF)-like protein
MTGQPQPRAAAGSRLAADLYPKVLWLAFGYGFSGALGLLLAIPPGYATAVWPPSGIALAALLLWGPRVWPGVWLGSFLVNVWVSLGPSHAAISFANVLVAASIGVGSTLQALLGAFLLQRWLGIGKVFESGPAVLSFAAIEALSCTLASTWGVTTLGLAGIVNPGAYADSWRTWWLGDLIGVLVITPAMLTWRQLLDLDRRRWHRAEAIGLLLLLALLTGFVFFSPTPLGRGAYPLTFLPLASLVWIAFRLNPGSVAIATCCVSAVAVFATTHGIGPFARDNTNESLLLLQSFTGLIIMTALTLAAAASGHKKSAAALRRLSIDMERLALTDEMTGLHNRRGFFLLADQGLRMARRTQARCLLVFADLDGLKQLNDTQGHVAGDAMIVAAARVLSRVFRESDVIARLGGDEFAVLAFVDDSDTSVAVGKRLQAGIDEFNGQSGRPFQLSISFGIEELPGTGDVSLEDLISQADHAMYGRKRERRQRDRAVD